MTSCKSTTTSEPAHRFAKAINLRRILLVRVHAPSIALFVSMVTLAVGLAANAQVVQTVATDQRSYIANAIENGVEPIDIRVNAIHDWVLVRSIIRGSSSRKVKILVDKPSQNLDDLASMPNVDVRLLALPATGRSRSALLPKSTVTVLHGGGAFTEVTGPPVWEESAFGGVTMVIESSGAAPWESKAPMRDFDREFAVARKLETRTAHVRTEHVYLAILIAAALVVSWVLRKKQTYSKTGPQ